MLPRHANILLSRLDDVIDLGAIEIRRTELTRWYNLERLTVSAWRDVHEKWIEVLEYAGENKDSPLLVGPLGGSDAYSYLFVWGEGLGLTEKSWLKDIRNLIRNKESA